MIGIIVVDTILSIHIIVTHMPVIMDNSSNIQINSTCTTQLQVMVHLIHMVTIQCIVHLIPCITLAYLFTTTTICILITPIIYKELVTCNKIGSLFISSNYSCFDSAASLEVAPVCNFSP